MRRIGITGPTGAGKTTALHALTTLGAQIIDCDGVYHELLARSVPMQGALTARFGMELLGADGSIDRKRLGNVVFGDKRALADLNGITHRFVRSEVERQCGEAERRGCPAAAIDAIALIESGLGGTCDAVVGILAPKTLRIRRIMAREGIPEDYARRRADAQPEDAFYRENCDYILENREDDTPQAFQARALALFQRILTQE